MGLNCDKTGTMMINDDNDVMMTSPGQRTLEKQTRKQIRLEILKKHTAKQLSQL